MDGFEANFGLCHRRLMHCTSNLNIWNPFSFVERLEKLVNYQYEEREICPECMIAKCARQDNPGDARRATWPLGKDIVDLIRSLITSIDGYNYAMLLFAYGIYVAVWDDGLKTNDDLVQL